MFIYNYLITVMFSEIESFSTEKNYKGGHFGNIWVRTKTGAKELFNYDENRYSTPEDARMAIADKIRDAILNNKPIAF